MGDSEWFGTIGMTFVHICTTIVPYHLQEWYGNGANCKFLLSEPYCADDLCRRVWLGIPNKWEPFKRTSENAVKREAIQQTRVVCHTIFFHASAPQKNWWFPHSKRSEVDYWVALCWICHIATTVDTRQDLQAANGCGYPVTSVEHPINDQISLSWDVPLPFVGYGWL